MASPPLSDRLLTATGLPSKSRHYKALYFVAGFASATVIATALTALAFRRGGALADGQASTAFLATSSPKLWTPGHPVEWMKHAWEGRLIFEMPYMNFTEQVYVHADPDNGLQSMSYYSGANIFLCNVSGRSFELVPVEETMSCLVTETVKKLETFFPDLDVFLKQGTQRKVTLVDDNGVESVGYEFKLTTAGPKDDPTAAYTYTETVGGMTGTYTYVMNASAGGVPVNVTFLGANAFLVTSHQDEYRLVYKRIAPRPDGIDASIFKAPQGISCSPFSNPAGPIMRSPMRHFGMVFPGSEGVSQQPTALAAVAPHMKQSCGSSTECLSRRELALRHYEMIQAHNHRNESFTLGVNHMIDWTVEERQALLGRRARPVELLGDIASELSPDICGLYRGDWDRDVPLDFDYRGTGYVGPPRDQGTCGSCWAFGTIGMIEGQVYRKTGKLTRMSEQHILDCSWAANNLGCDGGEDTGAYSWLMQRNRGELPTAASYGTYLSQNGFCHFDRSKNITGLKGVVDPPPGAQNEVVVGAVVASCWHVPQFLAGGTEKDALAAAHYLRVAVVSEGPMSVGVQVTHPYFYFYKQGVLDLPACVKTQTESIDHAVILTGFGRDSRSGKDYWNIRNSWSSHWGEGGFMRISTEGAGCGITRAATFALLA